MKSFLIPLLVLIFSSCSQDNIIESDNSAEHIIQKRSNFECIEDATCDLNYVFPVKDSEFYYNFTVKFDNTLTEADIYCVKQAYFKCFPLLRMAIFQSTNPYQEIWCYPIGKPTNTISTTMDNDPRVEDGG